MKFPRSALRIIFYPLSIVVSISIIASLVIVSWWLAHLKEQNKPLRVRWYIVAKTKVLKGTKLTGENLTGRLGRLSVDAPFIPTATPAVGKYALSDIDEGTPLNPSNLSESAPAKTPAGGPVVPAEAPAGGAVVPVEVKTYHASSLKPGMRLAFVKANKILPSVKDLGTEKIDHGFLLLSVTTSPQDPAITALTVKVPKNKMDSVAILATGQWRPVILSPLSK